MVSVGVESLLSAQRRHNGTVESDQYEVWPSLFEAYVVSHGGLDEKVMSENTIEVGDLVCQRYGEDQMCGSSMLVLAIEENGDVRMDRHPNGEAHEYVIPRSRLHHLQIFCKAQSLRSGVLRHRS